MSSAQQATRRLESIDQFRGFAILLMVLANYLGVPNRVPSWLKHAPDIGLTVIDLIAPMFIFAIGLTYGLSARRRAGDAGRMPAVEHLIERFLAMLGMGALIEAGGVWLGFDSSGINWGVLQAIGAAGLLTLPTIWASTWLRLGIGLALLGGYQVLLDRYWLESVLHSPHGGIQGSLGWGAMLILATVLADLFHDLRRRRSKYPWACALTVCGGVALALWVPVSKSRISASYVLLSLGASGLLFEVFDLLATYMHVRVSLLSAWGRNPLVLYLLHYLILGLFALPKADWWYVGAPWWLILVQVLGLVGVLSWIGWYLSRKGWFFAL